MHVNASVHVITEYNLKRFLIIYLNYFNMLSDDNLNLNLKLQSFQQKTQNYDDGDFPSDAFLNLY